MRYIVTLFLLVFFGGNTYAARYFDFFSDTYLVDYLSEVDTNIIFEFKGYDVSDFSIRPVVSNGVAYIYDSSSEDWVPGNDLWTNMPHLNKSIQLKLLFSGVNNLKFQIQDLSTGKIYETDERAYFSFSKLQWYQTRLKLKR